MKIMILFDCRFILFCFVSFPPATFDISLCILGENLFTKGVC